MIETKVYESMQKKTTMNNNSETQVKLFNFTTDLHNKRVSKTILRIRIISCMSTIFNHVTIKLIIYTAR